MNWRDSWDLLVNGYNFPEEAATDILNAADTEEVMEIRLRYAPTVNLLVRRVSYNNLVIDETDA